MSSLKALDKKKLEDLFGASSGYVMDFSNQTFEEFFRTIVSTNIYDQKYAIYGESKGKRLKAFWELESDQITGKALKEMLEIWKYNQQKASKPIDTPNFNDCVKIVNNLLGVKSAEPHETEDHFLKAEFGKISWEKLNIEPSVIPILTHRLEEAQKCLNSGAYLSTIFMAGSILEGLMLGVATKNPKEFNTANSSPKKDNKVKQFHDWSLAEFIDVAHECNYIGLDVKKFSHALRDFRNFVHPFQQLSTGFKPDDHTAKISMQVLNAALASLTGQRSK